MKKSAMILPLAGRNFMRQDPDVMLLGEIRDEETAKIAIRASITGHLVLSTLHANDAVYCHTEAYRPESRPFPHVIFAACRYGPASYQEGMRILQKRICPERRGNCRFKEVGITTSAPVKGIGCPKCNGTGYSGRIVIGEIMIVDDDIREMIYSGGHRSPSLKTAAVKKGMVPLKESALRKAAEGITTFDEVMRVTG